MSLPKQVLKPDGQINISQSNPQNQPKPLTLNIRQDVPAVQTGSLELPQASKVKAPTQPQPQPQAVSTSQVASASSGASP